MTGATRTTGAILDGIRVVDLSSGLAGPVATQMLAEAGADVVKVEPPGGDPVRTRHPSAFATWNRSKRSVVLDLADPADTATLRSMLATADVLVHGLRPATAARHALDDSTLAAEFPALVVCGVTGWPAGHADAERPGYDLLVQAREGLMDIQAGWRDGPFAWRFPAPSWGAAFLAVAGIVARLIHRESCGAGGPAHTSLAQGVHLIQNMAWNRAEAPSASLIEGQPGTLTNTQAAMYECSDGRWLQILNPADRVDLSVLPLMRAALGALGRADDAFDADVMRVAMREHPADAWLAEIRAVDVAVERIAPLGSLFSEEEVLANAFVVDVDDPDRGRTRQAATPFRTEPPPSVRCAAPRLGEGGTDTSGATTPPVVGAGGARRARPLAGLRVVDFGAYLAGPLASMLLADLGAEVVKVEPVAGDPVRGWRDGFFAACNRGKRGIALDVRHPEGGRVRDRLIRSADVVHHNVRLRSAAKLGLDEPAVRALNADAVFSHVSAYGTRGPRADWPGYDSVFQAMAGWNIENAGTGNPPLFHHLGALDTLTAASSAVATLLALFQRARTGRPSATAAALLSTAVFTAGETFLDSAGAVAPYPRLDRDQTGLGPGYRIYPTADGWIAVVAPGEAGLAALRAVAAVEDDAALSTAFVERTTADAADALARGGVAAEPVREFHWFSVWDDEENRRTGLVTSYPQHDWGEMQQFGVYWDFGDLELRLDRACPAVGEHTAEVLGELGFTPAEVERLARDGVICATE